MTNIDSAMESHDPNKNGNQTAAQYNLSASPGVTAAGNSVTNQPNNTLQIKKNGGKSSTSDEKDIEPIQEKLIWYDKKMLVWYYISLDMFALHS